MDVIFFSAVLINEGKTYKIILSIIRVICCTNNINKLREERTLSVCFSLLKYKEKVMNHYTNIDTVAIQVELEDAKTQREVLEQLLQFLRERRYFIKYQEYTIGLGMKRGEHSIYLNNTTVATINTGVYQRVVPIGDERKKVLYYYIAVKFAGLKRYNEILDTTSYDVLMLYCAYFNSEGIPFVPIELDICLDVKCRFEQMLALCAKRSPKTSYCGLAEPQMYVETTYLEKIEVNKVDQSVRRAYYYDKSYKEGLSFPLTRFEVKLQPKYFGKHGYSVESIMQVLDRYYVMYFENMEEKRVLMTQYEENQFERRKKEAVLEEMQQYRLFFDAYAIRAFLNELYTVRLLS